MRPVRIGVGATFPITNPGAYSDALNQLDVLIGASQLQVAAVILAIQTLDADAAQFDSSDRTALTSSDDYTGLIGSVATLNSLPTGPLGAPAAVPVLADIAQRAQKIKSTLTLMLAKAATSQPTKSASYFTPGRIGGALVGGGLGLLIGGPVGAVVGSIVGIVVDGSITGKSA